MKFGRIIAAIVLLCVVFSTVSCSGQKYRIAVITDVSEIDGNTVSRYAWEGAAAYAEKHNVSCAYYKPSKEDASVLFDSVAKAVSGGAEIVVLSGKMFETVCYKAQKEYPDVCFVLLDGQSRDESGTVTYIASNTACAVFNEKDAGFAAGYALVADGITALGFVGSGENCFAGFIQGADKAAAERDLDVNYEAYFVKDYDSAESIKTKAEEMYTDGVDVILTEGDGTLKPVSDAAKEKNGRLVGSYTDKRYYSERVITSAVKNYEYVVNRIVTAYFENRFSEYGGKVTVYGKDNGGTGLPTKVNSDSNGNAFDRFTAFNAGEYRELVSKMASGTYGTVNGEGVSAPGADIGNMLGLKRSVYGFPETEEEAPQ